MRFAPSRKACHQLPVLIPVLAHHLLAFEERTIGAPLALPEVIPRMSKAGWDKDDIPAFTAEEEEDKVEDVALDLDPGDDGQTQEDTKAFTKRYVRKWWGHYQSLPHDGRPIFLPHTKFMDVFIRFQERALPSILWSKSKYTHNSAHKVAEKIMTRKAADNLVTDHFGSLLKTLFYGNRSLIKDC
ncbi:hypothetical protein BGX28_006509 [Mortierella sp. GBA30]|nr:hypothetical protein BGX28_006509 [Mortierella sp. GBA30]